MPEWLEGGRLGPVSLEGWGTCAPNWKPDDQACSRRRGNSTVLELVSGTCVFHHGEKHLQNLLQMKRGWILEFFGSLVCLLLQEKFSILLGCWTKFLRSDSPRKCGSIRIYFAFPRERPCACNWLFWRKWFFLVVVTPLPTYAPRLQVCKCLHLYQDWLYCQMIQITTNHLDLSAIS